MTFRRAATSHSPTGFFACSRSAPRKTTAWACARSLGALELPFDEGTEPGLENFQGLADAIVVGGCPGDAQFVARLLNTRLII